MDKLFVSLSVLFAVALYMALSQETLDGWGPWTDITLCTARPCGCFKREGVRNQGDCNNKGKYRGKVVQVRGCTSDICPYDKNRIGAIRKKDCVNFKKFCPEWSEWRASSKCDCKGNSTEGVRTESRNCTPSPIPEFKDMKCAINDDPDMDDMKHEKFNKCNCTEDDDDDVVETTTQPTTTPRIYCTCPNDTNSLYDNDDTSMGDVFGETSKKSRTATTSKKSTVTTSESTTHDPEYSIYDLDYGNAAEKLCLCNETMSNNNGTMNDDDGTMSDGSEGTTETPYGDDSDSSYY